jgi:hypothetical protein
MQKGKVWHFEIARVRTVSKQVNYAVQQPLKIQAIHELVEF